MEFLGNHSFTPSCYLQWKWAVICIVLPKTAQFCCTGATPLWSFAGEEIHNRKRPKSTGARSVQCAGSKLMERKTSQRLACLAPRAQRERPAQGSCWWNEGSYWGPFFKQRPIRRDQCFLKNAFRPDFVQNYLCPCSNIWNFSSINLI